MCCLLTEFVRGGAGGISNVSMRQARKLGSRRCACAIRWRFKLGEMGPTVVFICKCWMVITSLSLLSPQFERIDMIILFDDSGIFQPGISQ